MTSPQDKVASYQEEKCLFTEESWAAKNTREVGCFSIKRTQKVDLMLELNGSNENSMDSVRDKVEKALGG